MTHTYTKSLKISRFKKQSGNNGWTDGSMDATDCFTFPTNVVSNNAGD